MKSITDENRALVEALALMVAQYLEEGEVLDTLFMSAGEHALTVLGDYGLVDYRQGCRDGTWTEAGHRFLREP